MDIKILSMTDFKNFETSVEYKLLLNICSEYEWITDSNMFWDRYYKKPKEDFYKHKEKFLGNVFYTKIFSYHVIAHMVCVKWPKTWYNIKPFKIKEFDKCCKKLQKYCKENGFNSLYTPIFAKEIFEGNWNEILGVLAKNFPNKNLYIFREQT